MFPFQSVKYLNIVKELLIQTAHHTFLESRQLQVTKNPYYVLGISSWIFQKFFQRGEPSSVCHYQGELSLLRADSEVGVIFGPIMASFSQARIFFVKTINIISMYLSAPFVVQHSKISMQQIKSCSHISFLDPNYKRNFDFGSQA